MSDGIILGYTIGTITEIEFSSESMNFTIGSQTANKIKTVAEKEKSSVNTILLTAITVLLSKYIREEESIIENLVHSKDDSNQYNYVLMKSAVDEQETFRNFVLRTSSRPTELAEAFMNEDSYHNIIFDAVTMDSEIPLQKGLKFGIWTMFHETTQGIDGRLEFNAEYFDKIEVERFVQHFLNILNQATENPDIKLCEIDMLSAEEKQEILVDFNDTKVEYLKDKTIHQLFEEQVERQTDNTAVVYEGSKLTYRELNERANQLTRFLNSKGIGEGDIVGLLVERSLEMVVGILGILKAGGAYLPINPEYPRDRISYMIDDSKAKVVLTQRKFQSRADVAAEMIALDEEEIYAGDSSNVRNNVQSNNAAYVIYTSGSTGNPKGVVIEHRALHNYLNTKYHRFNGQVGEKDRCLSLTNISFDVSVGEIFLPLTYGAALVLFENAMVLDIEKLVHTIVKEKITYSYLPPTILKNVYELLSEHKDELALDKMLVGVEPIKDYILEDYMSLNENMQVINGYGPTEATICATMYHYGDKEPCGRNVCIGSPMLNTQIYILDRSGNAVPVGAAGELCISGDGLARGYLYRPELTSKKFVQNPFVSGQRMYKTGDLARWLPEGNIEFLGRIDYQVKIRGYRIELGEIESQLLKNEDVKEAVVVDKQDGLGNKYLCAYIVSDTEIQVTELRKKLARKLPDYMIPTYFMQIEKIPLTSNGKIYRKALPEPDGVVNTGVEYVAPRNEVEEKLIEIWNEVLEAGRIGTDDDFFILGGHSLKAIKMAAIIKKELMTEISVGDIFSHSTVRSLGEYIGKAIESEYSSIEAVEERELYEVSSAQKRMYVLNQLSKEQTNYNIPYILVFEGKLERIKVEESFKKLVERHEAFRTSFELADNEIMQRIHKDGEFKVEYDELDTDAEQAITSEAERFIRPFDLSKAPLLRVKLIKLAEEKYALILDMHHIISDGTSVSIILEEFAKLYKGEHLGALRVQYKDFSSWQNRLLDSEAIKKHEKYWIKAFGDEIPILNLPTDYPRPSTQSFEGESIGFRLDKKVTQKLRGISRAKGATLYMVLLTAYNILLSKYSGQEDIIVGSAAAGRPHDDLHKMVGMFVNTLAMRNYPVGKKKFAEFLQEVKCNSLNAYENQNYQFDMLVEKLNIKRDLSRNALFDTMFVFQNTDTKEIELNQIRTRGYEFKGKVSKFDMTLEAEEQANEIWFNLQYCTRLFKRESMERLIQHYINILNAVAENPEIKLYEIDMLSEQEKKEILIDFNNTKTPYQKEKTICEVFEDQVEKTPENIAVVYDGKRLTYRKLNEKANQLAEVLRSKGVKPDTIVGIMVERSLEMMIGIVGIIKAGGAYLPISPEHPSDRIKYMLEDSKTNILLTQTHLLSTISFDGTVINLEDEQIYQGNKTNPEIVNNPGNLAYVIYTSGSTGNPKGVMIQHGSVINLVTALGKAIYDRLTGPLNITMIAPYVFDASVKQIFASLLRGNCLHIIPEKYRTIGARLVDYYIDHSIDISDGTPSHFKLMLGDNNGNLKAIPVKHFVIGGEELTQTAVKDFYSFFEAKKPYITNIYGPTECTVDATAFLVDNDQLDTINTINTIPIGHPLANCRVYVLDQYHKLQPVGVAGELCIAGAGVARGYLNKPELTAEKFVTDPFAPEERMYRTGDLVRWLSDGNIEFLGRIDFQVKIRGYRIELGEIESQLLKSERIKSAVVLDKQDGQGNKYLCAYIAADREINVPELRKKLSQSLPDYMIPTYIIQIDKIPLNTNGKVDRRALPEPSGEIDTGVAYVAPRNEVEEKLIQIWSEVLEVGKIGINDDFFALGGHSLKAIKLVSIIQKELKAEISVGELFIHPTVKELGEHIGRSKEVEYSAIGILEERELYQVSSAQKRLFALNQFAKEEINYNIPFVLIVEGKLERDKVEESFKKLVERHEVFRTSFELADDEIMQRIHKAVEFKVEYEELNTDLQAVINSEVEKFVKPFDLSKAPLLRVKLVRLQEEKHILMFDMHHIISDGTSTSIIMEEFTKLYKGENLEALRIQYKDYSAWENRLLASEAMKKHEEYWVTMFRDEIPVLNLPTDHPRPSFQSFEGESLSFTLDRDLTKRLNEICKANIATLYMTLLASYNVLLSKYSGQEDIVVGSPIAGRPHADLHNIVGMFVNTLAMRNYPVRNKTFIEFLQEVKQSALSAYEHQGYQFDKLVEKLDINRDLSRNALFDSMFVMRNTENKEIRLDHANIRPHQFERGVSKFDITLGAEERGEEIHFDIEYCTKLFQRETIERMIGHFKNILKEVAENPEIKLCEIGMLSEEEKREILLDFNNTKAQYPEDKTICEAFEEQVKRVPDNIAAVYEGKKLTYRELNERANQLARVLRGKGVKPDTIVGMLIERSLDMMIGIVGILKAGGAYLPISPDYPDDRIKYMLEDSNTNILLTQKQLLDAVEFDGTVIDLEDEQLYQGDAADLEIVNEPCNLAYIIYTSGSTGRPKGVMIQHGSVINLVAALGKEIYDRYTDPLNVTMIAPYVFDSSVKQIFASLLRGNCLCIVPEEYKNVGEKLIEFYIENSIDISDGTPSHFKLMLGDNNGNINDIPVKHFIIGGEALPVDVVKDFLSFFEDRKPRITNIYGPTECTVDATAFLVDHNQLDTMSTIPIGCPLENYSVYVLDKDNMLQPVGVPGELCIAGAGVARGYLNKPELTEEKFAVNPFESGKKMYKTGDLVRWLPDGNVEFLGRIDHQVKIRGYRIEIGEIEALIKSHPSVKDAIVIVHTNSTGEKGLVAYVVPKSNSGEKYSEAELREYLKKQLPKYMVPAALIQLDKIPLNTNGKVDRFALPKPDMQQRDSDDSFVAPRNQAEIEMAEIWAKILGTPKIGIDDDFFDLGGDSFKAIRLVRSIKSGLGVMDLFKNSTIRSLAAFLSKDVAAERTMLHELTKPVNEKDRIASIICFPYGGGRAISYQALAGALPKNYSLYSVELPGHDYSCPDEELASIEESAARCFQEIIQKVKGPVVLYGHCLGVTMATLLAFKLEEAGLQVDGVFAGAMFPAPRISNGFFRIWDKIFPSQLSDKGNRDMLITIGGLDSEMSSDETEFVLRNLMHDSKECRKWYTQFYSSKEMKKFKAPITCVIGEGDRATEFYQERYKDWERFSDNVDLKTIEHAGHFFIKNQASELAEIIKEKVDLWQGRTPWALEIMKADKGKESTARPVDLKKKQVVPSMNLFLIVAMVQIISEVGTILSTFGTGIWIFKQTHVLSQFAMMLMLGILPMILVLPFSGAVVDRFNRRLILIASDILSAICSLSLLILLYVNGLQIWHVYIFTIAASVAGCFRQPAYMAAITQITPKMYLPQANSVSQFSTAIGRVLAAVCGGIFMDYIGFKGLVAIDFATFVVSVVTMSFLRFPDTMFTRLEEPIHKELLGGWNFIIKRKSMVAMVVFFLIVNFMVGIYDVTMTPLILSFTDSTALGVINAFAGIGLLCGAIAMLATGGMKKRAKGMVGFVALYAVAIMIAGIRPLPVFAAMAMFVGAFSSAVLNIHWQSLIQVKVGLELQGRVFAVNRMLVAILAPFSYFTAGVLADQVFASMMGNSVLNSPIANLILGVGAGRGMRLSLLLAGAILFVWTILGLRYKPLSEMDDILEDATPGEVIIKDKDKLQEMIDRKIKVGQYTWMDETAINNED